MYKHCFPEGPSDRTETKEIQFLNAGVPGGKPVEASLDRKPNGHTAPGTRIEPRLSGPWCPGSTAMLPAPQYWQNT